MTLTQECDLPRLRIRLSSRSLVVGIGNFAFHRGRRPIFCVSPWFQLAETGGEFEGA